MTVGEDLCFFFAGIFIRGVPCLFFFFLFVLGLLELELGEKR